MSRNSTRSINSRMAFRNSRMTSNVSKLNLSPDPRSFRESRIEFWVSSFERLPIYIWAVLYSRFCIKKYWSSVLQIWHQKCTSQKKRNATDYIVAMATPLASVSFCEKPNIPTCNLFEWDRMSSSEQTWFPHCLSSPQWIVGSGWSLCKMKSENFSCN